MLQHAESLGHRGCPRMTLSSCSERRPIGPSGLMSLKGQLIARPANGQLCQIVPHERCTTSQANSANREPSMNTCTNGGLQ
jgi:hypothetical protein